MKILQLTYSLKAGGGERFVADLSNELCKQNDVTLVQIQSNDDEQNAFYLPDIDSRIHYINLGCNKGISFRVFKKVHRIIKQVKPDVVHAHTSLIVLILAATFYRKAQYFHTLHSLAQRCLIKRLKPVFKYLYRSKIMPVTISQTCMESYEDLYHLKNGAIITNGRSPIQTTSLREKVKAEIDSFKGHSDDKIFLHVSRVHPVKNQELLFETFDKLISEGEHVQLVVIGNGYNGSKFQAFASHPGIHILGEKNNVGDYLAVSDYFVLSSKMEGLPISLLEAMSMGLIPVSTPAGGVCDVIRDKDNGYLSPSHSPEDFYQTIKNAISNKSKVSPAKIISEYQEKYSMEACARKYMELFDSQCHNKSKR